MHTRLFGLSLLILASCTTNYYHLSAFDKVAFDRPGCPTSAMHVVRESNDGRTLEVNACGTIVKYQDVGSERLFSRANWLNVTERGVPFPSDERRAGPDAK